MGWSASGGGVCGILDFWGGSAPPATQGFGGRAVVQSGNGVIFAGLCRFNPDEPEHGVFPARSSVVQLKHARDKSRGLAAVIQARIERGQRAVGRNDVSRETIVISDS